MLMHSKGNIGTILFKNAICYSSHNVGFGFESSIWQVFRLLMVWNEDTVGQPAGACSDALKPPTRWQECKENGSAIMFVAFTDTSVRVICQIWGCMKRCIFFSRNPCRQVSIWSEMCTRYVSRGVLVLS